MTKRISVLIVLILATALYTRFLSDVHAVPLQKPLASVPMEIGEWRGEADAMSEQIVSVVGVEDYLLREYRSPQGAVASVYVGFYEQQREGDQIHSPKHCLPGAGWRPTESETITFETPGFNGGTTRANRYVIAKGNQNQVVLYWYQSRGRNITSEYWAKVWLVVDSIFRKRNDGALVRFIAPVAPGQPLATAEARLQDFASRFLPELAPVLPN